jgi:hypothetical protein
VTNRWIGSIYRVDTLDKWMIHIPDRTEEDGLRFHGASQNVLQLKVDKLFIFGIFDLIFSKCG